MAISELYLLRDWKIVPALTQQIKIEYQRCVSERAVIILKCATSNIAKGKSMISDDKQNSTAIYITNIENETISMWQSNWIQFLSEKRCKNQAKIESA